MKKLWEMIGLTIGILILIAIFVPILYAMIGMFVQIWSFMIEHPLPWRL